MNEKLLESIEFFDEDDIKEFTFKHLSGIPDEYLEKSTNLDNKRLKAQIGLANKEVFKMISNYIFILGQVKSFVSQIKFETEDKKLLNEVSIERERRGEYFVKKYIEYLVKRELRKTNDGYMIEIGPIKNDYRESYDLLKYLVKEDIIKKHNNFSYVYSLIEKLKKEYDNLTVHDDDWGDLPKL